MVQEVDTAIGVDVYNNLKRQKFCPPVNYIIKADHIFVPAARGQILWLHIEQFQKCVILQYYVLLRFRTKIIFQIGYSSKQEMHSWKIKLHSWSFTHVINLYNPMFILIDALP